jgi:hypothetical protein
VVPDQCSVVIAADGCRRFFATPSASYVGRVTTYDTMGGTYLQAAIDASPMAMLVPDSKLVLDTSVFFNEASALGTATRGSYIIDGQGTATIQFGTGLPTVGTYTMDPACQWALHVNNKQTALSGGAVDQTPGSEPPAAGSPHRIA